MTDTTKPPKIDSDFDRVNEHFHDSYDAAKEIHRLESPVFLVLADSLILHRKNEKGKAERTAWEFTPPLFHVLKSVSHAPIALYARLLKKDGGEAWVKKLDDALHRAEARLDSLDGVPDHMARDARKLLELTAAFIHEGVLDGSGSSVQAANRFAESTKELLLLLTRHATEIQLTALHDAVQEALAKLSPEERETVEVVVMGDHQARNRSLGMQYFRKVLGEPEGSEDRVTYGESITSEDEALTLMATRRVDRPVAMAFFGDEKRLQRDVLGDAVEEALATRDYPVIE